LTANNQEPQPSVYDSQKFFEQSAMQFLNEQMQRVAQREIIMGEVRRRNAEMVFMKHQAEA
jgi:hypothetical protein